MGGGREAYRGHARDSSVKRCARTRLTARWRCSGASCAVCCSLACARIVCVSLSLCVSAAPWISYGVCFCGCMLCANSLQGGEELLKNLGFVEMDNEQGEQVLRLRDSLPPHPGPSWFPAARRALQAFLAEQGVSSSIYSCTTTTSSFFSSTASGYFTPHPCTQPSIPCAPTHDVASHYVSLVYPRVHMHVLALISAPGST